MQLGNGGVDTRHRPRREVTAEQAARSPSCDPNGVQFAHLGAGIALEATPTFRTIACVRQASRVTDDADVREACHGRGCREKTPMPLRNRHDAPPPPRNPHAAGRLTSHSRSHVALLSPVVGQRLFSRPERLSL